MSGGWSADVSQFNRATQAQRQPGSSFKPMVYLTALEAGFSPSQKVLDAPFVQNLGAQGQWRPNNYGMTFSGPTSMRIALEKSLNLVTVRLADKVGMDAVAQNAIAFHVVDGMPKVLSASLGAVETTVLRQASAYAGLAMGGREVLPSLVDSVQDRSGKLIWRPGGLECQGCQDPSKPPTVVDNRRVIADPASVAQLVTMMQGVVTKGSGYAAGAGLGRAIAGKTGTSENENDAWFAGFTNEITVVVWVGYDNADGTRKTLGRGQTGGHVSVPIASAIFQAAWANGVAKTTLAPPSPEARQMLVDLSIDPRSGQRVSGGGFTEHFRKAADGRLADTQYKLLPRENAYAMRPDAEDGDLSGLEDGADVAGDAYGIGRAVAVGMRKHKELITIPKFTRSIRDASSPNCLVYSLRW
jgi:membrane carboxypeptidase/penicillin-binding protein